MTYAAAKSILVFLGLLVSFGVFAARTFRLLWPAMRRGRPDPPFAQWRQRLGGVLVYAFGQRRLFRFLLPGIAHFFIFWGFVILSLTILQAVLEGLLAFRTVDFILPGIGSWGPLALLEDLLAAAVAIAVAYALFLRLVLKPARYEGSHKAEGVMVLAFILTIMATLLLMNAIRGNRGVDPVSSWRPISTLMGAMLRPAPEGLQAALGEGAYWIHLGVILAFLAMLPGGKHFHVVTSLPAVLLRNLEPPGRLPGAPVPDGRSTPGSVEMFTRRQILDFFTCTECGRCQEVCPAHASGLELSPKTLIMSLRLELSSDGAGVADRSAAPRPRQVAGEVVSEQAIWQCTSCYACDAECPLFIEHVAPLIDVRRHLVLEGRMDPRLQDVLDSLGRYGNSFGLAERARAKWTERLSQPVPDARKQPVEFLWFLGDYAACHPGLAESTAATAQLFQKIGLDFGILYEGERNAGNDVRRVGEEGLFELLREKNLEALGGARFRSIVTTDPHSYNTLKNEYALDGKDGAEVLHVSELLSRRLASGDWRLSRVLGYRVTYHDPCYLGRYNGVYDAPRRVIAAAGCDLVEMPRHGDRAMCCGAGGGRIWMDEGPIRERPSEIRVREAAALDGVGQLVVACPKDVAMFRDAVKTVGLEGRLVIRELTELFHEAL